MRIVAEYQGEKIILKKYQSYLEMDEDLSSFKSKNEMMKKLGLNKEISDIYLEDNNGNLKDINFDFDLLRKTLSYYENRKGDEFVRWIFYSACRSHDRGTNRKKLYSCFADRLIKFTKNDKNFNPDSINNSEGKRIYSLICNIMEGLTIYGEPSVLKNIGANEIIPKLESYFKKNGKYDYADMRNFIISLSQKKYNLKETNIEIRETNINRQKELVGKFGDSIKSYFVTKKQITLDELTKEDDIINSSYDENGEKIDEIPFHQEKIEKAKKLRG